MAYYGNKRRQFKLINMTSVPLQIRLADWHPVLKPLQDGRDIDTVRFPMITYISDGKTLTQRIDNLPKRDGCRLFFTTTEVAEVARQQERYDVVGVRDSIRPLKLKFEGSRSCGFGAPKVRGDFRLWPFGDEERRWEEPLVTGSLIDSYLSPPQPNVIYLAPDWVVKHACLLGRADYLAIA